MLRRPRAPRALAADQITWHSFTSITTIYELFIYFQPQAVRVCYWQAKEPEKFTPDTFPCLIVTSPEGDELYGMPTIEYPGMIKVRRAAHSSDSLYIRCIQLQLCLHEGAKVDPNSRDVSKSDTGRFVAVPSAHIAKHLPGLVSERPAIVDTCMYTVRCKLYKLRRSGYATLRSSIMIARVATLTAKNSSSCHRFRKATTLHQQCVYQSIVTATCPLAVGTTANM